MAQSTSGWGGSGIHFRDRIALRHVIRSCQSSSVDGTVHSPAVDVILLCLQRQDPNSFRSPAMERYSRVRRLCVPLFLRSYISPNAESGGLQNGHRLVIPICEERIQVL